MPNLYDKAVSVTEEYLGPAGERFIRRQISTHLHIKPESLNKDHLQKLTDWASIAFALLTDNPKDVKNFSNDLRSLKASRK